MAPISAENYASAGGASSPNPNSVENDKSNVIRFNVTKNELYRLDDGYKTLMRRQKGKVKFSLLLSTKLIRVKISVQEITIIISYIIIFYTMS